MLTALICQASPQEFILSRQTKAGLCWLKSVVKRKFNPTHQPMHATCHELNAGAASRLRTLHEGRKAHLLKLNIPMPGPPRGIELDTPTKAPTMPRKIERWNGFSVTNTSQNEAKLTYIKLNRQTPSAFAIKLRPDKCPPRGAGSPAIAASDGGSRSTKRMVGGSFTLQAQFAFGHGGDHPGYVAPSFSPAAGRGRTESIPRS
jgi:hypothetical protein